MLPDTEHEYINTMKANPTWREGTFLAERAMSSKPAGGLQVKQFHEVV